MNSLDCTDIKALLSGYMDDQLDPAIRHQVERHLAECAPCRSHVNETERIDSLIALSGEIAMQQEQALPRGFTEGVLARTVRAHEQRDNFVFRNAVTWTGWFAAAASVTLALMIWFNEDRGLIGPGVQPGLTGIMTDNVSLTSPQYATGVNLRSSTFDGTFASPDALRSATTFDSEWAMSFVEPQMSMRGYRIVPALTRDEADAIYNVSLLMHILADSHEGTVEDVDRVRQVAMADHLIERLAEVRQRLDAEDRPALLAAESVLLRVTHGPLDADDIQFVRDTVTQLDLSSRIGEITQRWDDAHRL